jgi:hypothetical protein
MLLRDSRLCVARGTVLLRLFLLMFLRALDVKMFSYRPHKNFRLRFFHAFYDFFMTLLPYWVTWQPLGASVGLLKGVTNSPVALLAGTLSYSHTPVW